MDARIDFMYELDTFDVLCTQVYQGEVYSYSEFTERNRIEMHSTYPVSCENKNEL